MCIRDRLYRFPEAQLVKLINPFLLDGRDVGGLGLSTAQVGFVYGTIGILGLTVGGIIGGIVAAKGGLKKWLMPMAWSISLTCATFLYLAIVQPTDMLSINICAVSYTHLDVYKRQGVITVLPRFMPCVLPCRVRARWYMSTSHYIRCRLLLPVRHSLIT